MKKSTNTSHTLQPASKIKLITSIFKIPRVSTPWPSDKTKQSHNSRSSKPISKNKKTIWKLSTLRISISGSRFKKTQTPPKNVSFSSLPPTLQYKFKKTNTVMIKNLFTENSNLFQKPYVTLQSLNQTHLLQSQ